MNSKTIVGRFTVSTVRLPFHNGQPYETCIFSNNSGHSEVVERYKTKWNAINGHSKWVSKCGWNMFSFEE